MIAEWNEDRGHAKERQPHLLSTPAAAKLLDLSPVQFLRLAEKSGIEPKGPFKSLINLHGPDCPLWPAERIQALVGSPEVAAIKAAAKKPPKRKGK